MVIITAMAMVTDTETRITDSMKIVFPVAGLGTRLKPFTLELPKCLLPVAGKTILDYIVESTLSLPGVSERLFITGYRAGAVENHLKSMRWGSTRCVLQSDPQGLGEAVSLVLPYVNDDEPLLIILGDTLFEADLSAIVANPDNVLVTKKVADPERFGVAVRGADGFVSRLVEKSAEFVSDEALVGIYYIRDVRALRECLAKMMSGNLRTRGEFQLTDALQMMIELGCRFATSGITQWLDCGLPETLLATNARMLPGNPGAGAGVFLNSQIIPPCHIGSGCDIRGSRIGPNVSIADGCCIENSQLENAILWDGAVVRDAEISASVLGCRASVVGKKGSFLLGSDSQG